MSKIKAGFTLIELLVIVVIMAILAGATFALLGAGDDSSAEAVTQKNIQALANLVETYKNEYGEYPEVVGTSVSYSVILKSDSCDECKGKISDIGGDFGLASHFVGKASVIYNDKSARERISDFNSAIRSGKNQQESWRKAFADYAKEKDPIEACANAEATDNRLSRLQMHWARLEKEGIVEKKVVGCVKCSKYAYVAGPKPDGWGTPLQYRTSGGGFEILSAGADRKFGTEDDISSQGSGAKTNVKRSDDSIYD